MSDTFNDLYKEFRNRLRPFNAPSIIAAALRAMRLIKSGSPEHLRHAPWNIMLIVKWALQDPMLKDKGGRDISADEFDDIRQKLHELADQLHPFQKVPLDLLMRRMINPQIPFQRQPTSAFVRHAALLRQLEAQHPLLRTFQNQVGLEFDDFIDLAFASYAIVMNGSTVLTSTFDELSPQYSRETIERYLGLVSRDIFGLREFCKQLPRAGRPVASEVFEFTPIRRIPFIVVDDRLACWHPIVFYRGMEEIVHLAMSGDGDKYAQEFGRLFEAHVRREIGSSGVQALYEEHLKALVPQDTRIPDALLLYPRINVFIEAKAGLFDDSLMVVIDPEIFRHKTRKLSDAIHQGWETAVALGKNEAAPTDVRAAEVNYLIVVTSREVNAGSGGRLKKMYPDGELEYPSDAARKLLPLEHVYIISIDDFERLICAVRNDGLDIPKFLAACVDRDKSPITGKFLFDQHLAAESVRYGRSPLLDQEIDRAAERLQRVLPAVSGSL